MQKNKENVYFTGLWGNIHPCNMTIISFFDPKNPSETKLFSCYLFVTIQTFFGVFRQPRYILGGRTSVSLKIFTNYDLKI